MVKKTIVTNDNSRGLIPDFYAGNPKFFSDTPRLPGFDTKKALNVVRNDPVVKASIITIVDKVLEAGWTIKGRDKKSREKKLEQKLKDVRFNRLIRKALYNLILYNNVFIEIIKKGDELSDLNVLETTLMDIRAKDNGDVEFYKQIVQRNINGQQKGVEVGSWTPEQCVHIKLDEITNNTWSDLMIESLYDTVVLKDSVREWLKWFFQTNQMRGHFNIKGANDTKIKEFMSFYKASEKDKTKPIITEGEVTYEVLQNFAEQGKSLQEVLAWCDQQIIMLIQTPPISMGMSDSSGRSNSVEQNSSLNTRVKSVHDVTSDYFTYDLFPKINFGKNDFLWGTLDDTDRTRILENVQIMKNSMFTDEAITEYLEVRGLTFETKKLFKDPAEEAKKMAESMPTPEGPDSNKDVKTGNEGSIGNKSADAAPSRQRQSTNTLSKANGKSMVKNSKYNEYPYNYEVLK